MKLPDLASILLILAVVAVVVLRVVGWWRANRRRTGPGGQWPFEARRAVLSRPEAILYERLVRACPQQIILAQVQVSRILEVRRGAPVQAWLNRISRLSVDFLILRRDMSVVAAIELDDSSHAHPRRQEADARKNRAFEAAGVPLWRYSVQRIPDEAELHTVVSAAALELPRIIP